MRYVIVFLFVLQAMVPAQAQDKKASEALVEEISGVPFFMYAVPLDTYEVVGKALSFKEMLKLSTHQKSTVRQKVQKLVGTVLKKREEGKLAAFDAIIVDIDRDKTQVIKFAGKVSHRAKVARVKEVPLYFFSKPIAPYDTVAHLPPDFSRWAKRNLLFDKINSMVGRIKKKEEKGDIGAFDALIYNPDDLSAIAVKFKESAVDSMQNQSP